MGITTFPARSMKPNLLSFSTGKSFLGSGCRAQGLMRTNKTISASERKRVFAICVRCLPILKFAFRFQLPRNFGRTRARHDTDKARRESTRSDHLSGTG